jgi:hypothetical protein
MTIRYGVFDDELTEGWGVITISCNRAHYWSNPASGVALCGYQCRGWHVKRSGPKDEDCEIFVAHVPYTGRLRRTRGLKTDCQHCRNILTTRN